MKMPGKLREQLAVYNKAGFEINHVEARKGSHWLVVFDRVGSMIVTTNIGDPRAIKNNLGELRRRDRQLVADASQRASTQGSVGTLTKPQYHEARVAAIH